MPAGDRKIIGDDLQALEFGWPVGMPCRLMGKGLFELVKHAAEPIARLLFIAVDERLVLLHGFIKKTQKAPQADLDLALTRKKLGGTRMKNPPYRLDARILPPGGRPLRGSRRRCAEEGARLADRTAHGQAQGDKSPKWPGRMKTSRAAVDRLLDPGECLGHPSHIGTALPPPSASASELKLVKARPEPTLSKSSGALPSSSS